MRSPGPRPKILRGIKSKRFSSKVEETIKKWQKSDIFQLRTVSRTYEYLVEALVLDFKFNYLYFRSKKEEGYLCFTCACNFVLTSTNERSTRHLLCNSFEYNRN